MRYALITIAFLASTLLAQDAAKPAVLQTAPLTKSDPVYPAIARSAHISGNVVVRVTVGTDGKAQKAEAVSGPPLLRQSAVDAVKMWSWQPSAEAFTTEQIVPFVMDQGPSAKKNNAIAQSYFPAFDKCSTLMHGSDAHAAAEACVASADIAAQFSTNDRYIERRSAYVYAATALIHDKRPAEAMVYLDRAVEVLKAGKDDASGSAAVWSTRGLAEAQLGKFPEADHDLEKAEEFCHKALQSPAVKDSKAPYTRALLGVLALRAQVLQQMGQQDKAKQMQAEMAKLQQ